MSSYSINVGEGKKLVVQDNKHKVVEPNYYRMGNNTTNKHKIKSIDLLTELDGMSRSALKAVNMIKEGMVFDPLEKEVTFVVRVVMDTETQKTTFKRGFKELYEKDLVRRVKRGWYMINPRAIITNYKEQLKVWENCDEY